VVCCLGSEVVEVRKGVEVVVEGAAAVVVVMLVLLVLLLVLVLVVVLLLLLLVVVMLLVLLVVLVLVPVEMVLLVVLLMVLILMLLRVTATCAAELLRRRECAPAEAHLVEPLLPLRLIIAQVIPSRSDIIHCIAEIHAPCLLCPWRTRWNHECNWYIQIALVPLPGPAA
jgi:hypothetical protein